VEPFAVQSGEGKSLTTPTGDTVVIKAGTAATNGSLSILEIMVAAKSGPAQHCHQIDDEIWYVLKGEFRFKTAGRMFHASTGGMAFGPRGLPHGFQNIGDEPGKLLVITAPSGLERFFEAFAEIPPGADAMEALAAAGQVHGLEFVGPPLAISDPL
jgi:mannose-6-phosphate isomerase-like protein (cupin superfamily)